MMHQIPVALIVCLLASCAAPTHGSGRPGGSMPTSRGSTVYRTSATSGALSGGGTMGKSDDKLMVAGLITLGTSYVITVGMGQYSKTLFSEYDRMNGGDEVVANLWIPIVGPWTALGRNISAFGDDEVAIAADIGMAIGGVAQTTGLVLTVIGIRRLINNKGSAGNMGSRGESRRVMIVPHGDADGAGVTVLGRF